MPCSRSPADAGPHTAAHESRLPGDTRQVACCGLPVRALVDTRSGRLRRPDKPPYQVSAPGWRRLPDRQELIPQRHPVVRIAEEVA